LSYPANKQSGKDTENSN